MSAEKIVADFETCKKAAEIGLILDTVFVYDFNPFKEKFVIHISYEEEYTSSFPAPTAEEVPLPYRKITVNGEELCIKCLPDRIIVFPEHQPKKRTSFFVENYKNEASMRYDVAIWLIKNVPEARQWYVENGYLEEVNNESD